MLEYLISFVGLFVGYVISYYTKEELKQGKIYFKILEIVTLTIIIALLFAEFNFILFVAGLVIGFIFRYEYFYLGISAINFLDNNLRFLHACLIFVYGLASGSLNFENKKLILFNFAFFLLPFALLFLAFQATSLAAGALVSILFIKVWNLSA